MNDDKVYTQLEINGLGYKTSIIENAVIDLLPQPSTFVHLLFEKAKDTAYSLYPYLLKIVNNLDLEITVKISNPQEDNTVTYTVVAQKVVYTEKEEGGLALNETARWDRDSFEEGFKLLLSEKYGFDDFEKMVYMNEHKALIDLFEEIIVYDTVY